MLYCPFFERKNSQSAALQEESHTLTYKSCHQIIEKMVYCLQQCNIKEGSIVASRLTPSPYAILLFFALFRCRAIAYPMNRYMSPQQVQEHLAWLQPDLFLEDVHPFFQKIRQYPPSPQQNGQLESIQHATLLATSGTTGKPKLAMHSLGNLFCHARLSQKKFPIQNGDRYGLLLPLYHISGIAPLFRTFLHGATLVLLQKNPLSESLQKWNITHTSLIPTQLQKLPSFSNFKNLRGILLGGQPISPALYSLKIKQGFPLYLTYGMTEMTSQITIHPPSHCFSLGHPLENLMLFSGGEIGVKGKTLFQGYLQQNRSLIKPINNKGFFMTKDMGSYDPKTGLLFKGRKDRMFISGGENIHPEEIENILLSYSHVKKAMVTPVKNKEFGNRPVAKITVDSSCISQKKLMSFLESRLDKFKIPTKIFIKKTDSQ